MRTRKINFRRASRDFAYDTETGQLTWRRGRRQGKVAGTVNGNGYVVVDWLGRKWYAHRIILAMVGQHDMHKIIVDHENYRKNDNTLENLFPGDMRHNILRRRTSKRRLRYQGVEKRLHSWGWGYRATIIVNGRKLHGRGTKRAVDAYKDYLTIWVEHNGILTMPPKLAADFLRLC